MQKIRKITTSNLYISFLILLGFFSFLNLIFKNFTFNNNLIFELLFLIITFLMVIKLVIRKEIAVFNLILFFYIIYSLNYFFLFEYSSKFTDFLLIYKSFIYLFLLSFFVSKNYFEYNFLRKIFNILIFFFLVKYFLVILFNIGNNVRPQLFTENNFELMMLLILYIGVYSREKIINKWDLILLTIIFILSGSRSGIASFFIMLYFLDFGTLKRLKIFKFLLLTLGLVAITIIFLQRLGNGSIEDIDRVKFFYYFMKEIENWNIFNYLFGANFMTPMSYETSKALSFYKVLFSDYEHLLTYSVILHSFILRTIFDHGILGLCFLFFTVWKYLELSGYQTKEILSIVLILIATGLSVSSLNSIFVSLSLGLIIITKRNNFEKSI